MQNLINQTIKTLEEVELTFKKTKESIEKVDKFVQHNGGLKKLWIKLWLSLAGFILLMHLLTILGEVILNALRA